MPDFTEDKMKVNNFDEKIDNAWVQKLMGKNYANIETPANDKTKNVVRDSQSQIEKENKNLTEQIKTLKATVQELEKTVKILAIALSNIVENDGKCDMSKKNKVRNLINRDKVALESTEVDTLEKEKNENENVNKQCKQGAPKGKKGKQGRQRNNFGTGHLKQRKILE